MVPTTTVLKLEWLCASKDAQIGQLTTELAGARAALLIEAFRRELGASKDAQWNPQTFTFVEPPASSEDTAQPALLPQSPIEAA